MTFGTLQDVETRGKTVLVRVDFNSPIDPSSNTILDDKRFREHVPTIQALEDAKVVVLAHQSRPGKKDFTTLAAHADKLERLLGMPVNYVDDIFGSCAKRAVREAHPGDVILLENTRFSSEENLSLPAEEGAKTHLVRKLASMADLSAFCADHALKGFAPFAGLPGTAGGACFMNARCYGSEVADLLQNTKYFDFSTLSIKEYIFSPADWAYKVSPFQQNGGIILQSTFKVCTGKKADIIEESCKNIEDRKQKGHFSYPSAGSVFKNNRNFGMPSGKIIEEAGLKGTSIGAAQIAPWHGNFIINNGGASASQIKELVDFTKAKVEEKTGFQLECEVIFVDN